MKRKGGAGPKPAQAARERPPGERHQVRVEGSLGRKLSWVAVNHHNTHQHHPHIVVRGVDTTRWVTHHSSQPSQRKALG